MPEEKKVEKVVHCSLDHDLDNKQFIIELNGINYLFSQKGFTKFLYQALSYYNSIIGEQVMRTVSSFVDGDTVSEATQPAEGVSIAPEPENTIAKTDNKLLPVWDELLKRSTKEGPQDKEKTNNNEV